MARKLNINIRIVMMVVMMAMVTHASLSYVDLFSLSTNASVIQLDYSPDHNFLGVASAEKLSIYEGHAGEFFQEIMLESQQLKLTSFEFAGYQGYLILGTNNGTALIYQLNPQKTQFVKTQYEYISDIQSDVTSMCFSADYKYVVIGQQNNLINVWNFVKGSRAFGDFGGNFVFTVSCTAGFNYFVVGGGSSLDSKLTLYRVDPEISTLSYSVLKDLQTKPQETVFSTKVINNLIFNIGKKNYLSAYDMSIYNEQKSQFSSSTAPFFKNLKISDDMQIFAVANKSKLTILNYSRQTEQIIEVSSSPLAMASANGDNLAYMKGDHEISIAGLCSRGYFYRNGCEACQGDCDICAYSGGEQLCYLCADGFFLLDNKCAKCTVGCLTCHNESTCEICNELSHFIMKDGQCICQDGFYLYQDMCAPCMEGCLLCNEGSECEQCNEEKGFILNHGICECKEGSYDDSGVCKPCSRACLSCETDDFCYECDEGRHYILEERKCVCDGAGHFKDNGTDCVCENGYYLYNETCLQCLIGCSRCQNLDSCEECAPGFHLEAGLCRCDDPAQYIDIDQRACRNCSDVLPFCTQCSNPVSCTHCVEGIHRHLQSGHCPCDDGYYPDVSAVCQLCSMHGCLTCLAVDVCTQCDASGHWVLTNTSICECEARYAEIDGVCVLCPPGCLSCTKDGCEQCDTANHWEKDGNGSCKCLKGFFEDEEECKQCGEGCQECLNADQCLTCDQEAGYTLKDGKCVCDSGHFSHDQKCDKCSSYLKFCLECVSIDKCTTCSAPFVPVKSGQCGCPDGYFPDSNTCSKCGDGCLTCTGANKCTECEQGYVNDNGICKKIGPTLWKYILAILGVLVLADIIFQCLK